MFLALRSLRNFIIRHGLSNILLGSRTSPLSLHDSIAVKRLLEQMKPRGLPDDSQAAAGPQHYGAQDRVRAQGMRGAQDLREDHEERKREPQVSYNSSLFGVSYVSHAVAICKNKPGLFVLL